MKITVITINLNNIGGLKRTAQSVINQPSNDFEWIIVDGNSSDGSKEYIQNIKTCKNLKWISEKDNGIYDAMNKGTLMASGEYIIFMNSGDQFIPGILADGLISTLTADIEYGDCIVTADHVKFSLSKQPENLTFQNFYDGCICHQATFIKRNIQLKYPYDPSLKLASCRKFFIDTIIFGEIKANYISKPIAIYDTTGVSSTQRHKLLEELEEVIPQYIPPLLLKDLEKQRRTNRIIRNSKIFSTLEQAHSFSKRKDIFEKLVLILARLLLTKN